MAGRFDSYYVSSVNEEFDEEDVWAVVKENNNNNNNHHSKARKSKDPSPVSTLRRIPTASRVVPRTYKSFLNEGKLVQQSAPQNIPDWSKIYSKDAQKGSYLSWEDGDEEGNNVIVDGNSDKNDEGQEEEWIPPHEWLARKLARSQISSFSVCEGAGRTLKGRDLSKVRNAVLTRTGFLE